MINDKFKRELETPMMGNMWVEMRFEPLITVIAEFWGFSGALSGIRLDNVGMISEGLGVTESSEII